MTGYVTPVRHICPDNEDIEFRRGLQLNNAVAAEGTKFSNR